MAQFTKEEMLAEVARALEKKDRWRYDPATKKASLAGAVAVQLVELGDAAAATLGVGIHVLHFGKKITTIAALDAAHSARKTQLEAIAAVQAATDASELARLTDQVVHEINAALEDA